MARWYVLLAGVSIGWGTIPLVISQLGLPPAAIAFGRVSIAACALGAALFVATRVTCRGPEPRPYSVQPGRCVCTGVLLAAHWLTMFTAFDRAPAGTVILIIFLAPVGVALLAPRFIGERVSPQVLVAVSVGVVGVGLIAAPGVTDADPTGIGAALVSMLFLVVLNLVSKPLAETYGGIRLALMETGGAAVALAPIALLLVDWGPPGLHLGWLLVLGLVHTAAGVSLFLTVMRHLPVTHVSTLTYLEPVSVVVLAWLVLGDVPSALTLVGGALVLAAGCLVISSRPSVSLAPPEPLASREVAHVPG